MKTSPPKTIGNHVLIAMDTTPESLSLVRSVASALPNPAQTRVTLFHYLMPLLWEHGGDDSDPAAQRELERELKQLRRSEAEVEAKTDRYFDQATAILQQAGVPASHVDTKMDWDERDVAHAVLAELRAGVYSTVIVGQGHSNLFDRLFGRSLQDFLESEAHGVAVWAVESEEKV